MSISENSCAARPHDHGIQWRTPPPKSTQLYTEGLRTGLQRSTNAFPSAIESGAGLTGHEVLYENVSTLCELHDDGASLGCFHVDCDTPLVPVHADEVGALAYGRDTHSR